MNMQQVKMYNMCAEEVTEVIRYEKEGSTATKRIPWSLVKHKIIILGAGIAMCRVRIGQDSVQSNMEKSFWHSKC